MIYEYKKEKKKHTYKNESFYGKVTLTSEKPLTPQLLDACVLQLSTRPSGQGDIEYDNGTIHYDFMKTDAWELTDDNQ